MLYIQQVSSYSVDLRGVQLYGLALRHTVCGLEILQLIDSQNHQKARVMRAFCVLSFILSGPGDALLSAEYPYFLQLRFRQSLVGGFG